jgi:two-component system sensor histidine kinase/response regulator
MAEGNPDDNFNQRLQELVRGPVFQALNRLAPEARQDVQDAIEHLVDLAQDAHLEGERSKRKSHSLANLVETAPDCFWMSDSEGSVTYLNRAWEEWSGAPVSESLGAGWGQFIDERDRDRVEKKWKEMIPARTPFEVEFRLVNRKTSEIRWFLGRARPVKNLEGIYGGWSGTVIDVHEQRRVKEELASRVSDLQYLNDETEATRSKLGQSESLFRTMCEASPHLIWTCTQNGDSDFFNAQWCLYVGQNLVQCQSEGWLAAVHPEDLPRVSASWRKTLSEGLDYQLELRLRRYDGKYRWHTLRALPLRDDSGNISKWCGSCTDIEGYRRLVSELIEARDQAQEASKLKSEFVANMSHEIRTPMNGILGMVEILLRSELSASAREYVLSLKEAGRLLLSLLNDILDFSKIEAGRLEISNCEFDATSLIEGVGEILAPQADNKGLILSTFIDPRIPTIVVSDPLRIRQVLMNLGGNAIKFTNSGSVTIRADFLSRQNEAIKVKFSVIDTGIGIDSSGFERLFEPFVQVDGSISRRYGGTGLGLSISKRLIDLLGGQIEVVSEPQRGSNFSFVISMTAGAVITSTMDSLRVELPASRSTAIILDDDMHLTECLSGYCKAFGIKASACQTVNEVIDLINATEETGGTINVIIDAVRNGPLALEFYEKFLYDHKQNNVQILLLTTKDRKEEMKKLLPGSVSKAVTRPVRRSALKYYLSFTSSHLLPGADDQTISGGQEIAAGDRLTALVADDNKLNQQVARLLLEALNVEVEVVENGMEAVASFDSGKYDYVFLDCQMPELDGYAAARIIKKLQGQRQTEVPVIAMTANVMDGNREECLAAGMDDYLAKPIEPIELEKMLRKWSKKKDQLKITQNTAIDADKMHDAVNNNPRSVTQSQAQMLHVADPVDLQDEKEKEVVEPDIIDMVLLNSRFSDKNSIQLLQMFKESAREELRTIHGALEQQDFVATKSAAHSFKGACGTICAPSLAALLQSIEGGALQKDIVLTTRLCKELSEKVGTALVQIERYLNRPH